MTADLYRAAHQRARIRRRVCLVALPICAAVYLAYFLTRGALPAWMFVGSGIVAAVALLVLPVKVDKPCRHCGHVNGSHHPPSFDPGSTLHAGDVCTWCSECREAGR